MITSLAPGQSYDCPGASEVTMEDMSNIDRSICSKIQYTMSVILDFTVNE